MTPSSPRSPAKSRFTSSSRSEDTIRPADIDYHDGERYPVMVRVDGTKDYLDEITTPLAKPPVAK